MEKSDCNAYSIQCVFDSKINIIIKAHLQHLMMVVILNKQLLHPKLCKVNYMYTTCKVLYYKLIKNQQSKVLT